MKQSERLKSNSADIERNFTGKNDKRKKQNPDDRVNSISRYVSAQVSADVHAVPASGTEEKIRGPTSKDQDESSSIRSRDEENEERPGVKKCVDIESTTRNTQKINPLEKFDESSRPEYTDQRAAGCNSFVDFDWIAHVENCQFKFKLMIKSQELLPKHNLTACAEG